MSGISSSFKSKLPLTLEAAKMGLFRLSLMPEHHHHGVKIGPCGKLRAVRAEQNLNLLAGLALRGRCSPALKHLHEQGLMLRVKMGFRFFQQQEGNLIGMRLKQQQLRRHE